MTLELEPYWDATPKRKPSPRRDDCCCYFCSVPTSCLTLSIDCSCQAPVFSALSWTFLLRFMSIESVMLSNHLILSHSLLFLPSIFPKHQGLRIRWPKYWSFSINSSSEYSGLISFRIDWFYLLVVQGTLKSLLQHHSWKASILWRSAFFMVQLSHPYVNTGKTIALTVCTFVGKVMSLLFNILSSLS